MLWYCVRVRRVLSLYVGDDMPDEERRAIADHLKRCPECSRQEQGLRRSRDALLTLQETVVAPESSPSLWPALQAPLARLEQQSSSESSWLSAGAMIAASLTIGLVFVNRSSWSPNDSRSRTLPRFAATAPASDLTWPAAMSDRADFRLGPDPDLPGSRQPYYHLQIAHPVGMSAHEF